MRRVSHNTDEELSVWLNEFFYLKQEDFYQRGIENPVECWEEVVDNNGKYIND